MKDAFHRLLIQGEVDAVNPAAVGSKAAAWYQLSIPAGGEVTVRLRLTAEPGASGDAFGPDFDALVIQRRREPDDFYAARRDSPFDADERRIVRQADAGLVWSRQSYNYVVEQWLEGDPAQPQPPAVRGSGPNRAWGHLYARDVLSVPDTWEYPWFAAWDLAFQCVAMARVERVATVRASRQRG